MNDILNDNQKLALALELYNAGDISNAIKIIESYRPKGKWRISRVHGGIVKCDFCGFQWGSNEGRKFNYCPNCGADMRGEE